MKATPGFASVPIFFARGRRLPHALTGVLACMWSIVACAQPPPATYSPVAVCSTARPLPSLAYRSRVTAVDRALGLPLTYPIERGMRLTPEADTLVEVGYDVRGRSVRMAPLAAAALKKMIDTAAQDNVQLQMVSGFRTVAYQRRLVRSKLRRGLSLEAALRINAAPGFSEHHSGCAIDLTAPGAAPADESFAQTRAYQWLQHHAGEYGFRLSYPRDNPRGIEFEPWHWRYAVGTTSGMPPAGALAASASDAMPASAATTAIPDSR